MSRYLSTVGNWVNRLSKVSSQAEMTDDEDDNPPRAPSPRSQGKIDRFVRGFQGVPASVASLSPPPEAPPQLPFALTSPHITSDNGTLPMSPGGVHYMSPERPPPILHGRVHDIDIRVHPVPSPIPVPDPLPALVPDPNVEPPEQPRTSAYAHIMRTLREMPWLAPNRITIDWVAQPTRPKGPPQSWYTGQPRHDEDDLETGLGLGLEKGLETGKSSLSAKGGFPFPRQRGPTQDEEPIPPPPELYIQRSSNEPPQQIVFDPVHSPLVTRSTTSWLGMPFTGEPNMPVPTAL